MITTLVIGKTTITVEGNGTGVVSDYVSDRLNKAHNRYNSACEALKTEYATSHTGLNLEPVESAYNWWMDCLNVFEVVQKALQLYNDGRYTFPNGYIERKRS